MIDLQRAVEDFICDLTSFQELSSPITSFPTKPRNAGSSPNCKDNIPWFSSSAEEASAQKTAGRPKDWLNFTENLRFPIADWSRSAPTISLRQMNIAAESAPTGLFSPTQGGSFKRI